MKHKLVSVPCWKDSDHFELECERMSLKSFADPVRVKDSGD